MTLKLFTFGKANKKENEKQNQREKAIAEKIRKNQIQAERKERMRKICEVRKYCFGE